MSEEKNMEKYENYRHQKERLKKALKDEFYLEAVLIEYAIMEDRLESALVHAEAFNPKKHEMIKPKLKRLHSLGTERGTGFSRYYPEELLGAIESWIGRRNTLVHSLMKSSVDDGMLKDCAEEGKELTDRLDGRVSAYKRAITRANNKARL